MNIARTSFLVFCSTIFTGLFLFLANIFLARKLGAEGMGLYSLFSIIIATPILLGKLGIGTASFYFLNRKKKEASQIFSNLIVFGLVWGIVLASLVAIVTQIAPSLVRGLERQYLFIALLLIPMMLLYDYTLSLLWAAFRVLQWTLFSISHTFLILIGSIGFVGLLDMGFVGAIFAVVGGVVFPFFFTLLAAMKRFSIRFPVDLALLKDQIKFGLSAYLGDVFYVINFKVNFFIVNLFLGIASVGYYSVAYSVAATLFLIPFSLQQVLSPVWSSSREEQIDRETPRIGRQALLLGLLGAAFLALVGPSLIVFLYGSEFSPSIFPFLLMLPGGIFAAFATIFFNNFFAKGKPYITSLILLGALSLNIFLNTLFLPFLGVAGSALASSISYFFAAIVSLIVFQKMTKENFKKILKITPADITFLWNRLIGLFIPRREAFDELSSKDPKSLKKYFEQKAEKTAGVIKRTFESPHLYKRIFYAIRSDKIMELLDLKPEDKVLDVGCGEGYYTRRISLITPYVTATEIAENLLERAKASNPNPTVKYVCCPAEDLPFLDNSFDKVLMSDVLELLPDWRKGIEEVKRVLKPGGKFIITTRNKHSYLNFLFNLKIIIFNQPFTGDTIRQFSMRELTILLKEYFVVEKVSYANYFPLFCPQFLVNMFRFSKIKNLVEQIEGFCEKIPFLKDQAFILFLRVSKP